VRAGLVLLILLQMLLVALLLFPKVQRLVRRMPQVSPVRSLLEAHRPLMVALLQ
jgi:hypothetical protein